MNMIERVAKAICCPTGCEYPNQCSIPNTRDIIKAKAAIEAMRVPTDEMQNNYYDMRMATGHGKMQSCFPFAVWECAIDAALKE